jgi:two-component system cell cycle response regulator
MKVLVIDDCRQTVTLVKAQLAKEGLDVVSADCGHMGLEAIRHERPDLILLDVSMPDISGFDVCRTLKADSELCDIPVIFLSASDATEDTVRGLNLGAVDYITKPFDALELHARVNAGLRTKYTQDLLIQSTNVDPLTGLPNRKAMTTRLKEEWARVERHGRPLTLIMIEVDQFNRISDSNGRIAGDRALQVTSETIAEQCRRVDLPVRCGGAEFAIIVPDDSAEDSAILAERCQKLISKMQLKVNDEEIWVTASFGIADAAGKKCIKDLTRASCKALHEAKENGGNRVVIERSASPEPAGEPKP